MWPFYNKIYIIKLHFGGELKCKINSAKFKLITIDTSSHNEILDCMVAGNLLESKLFQFRATAHLGITSAETPRTHSMY
jgi:hypothetical protein